jgi:hypothetical protein
MSKYVSVIVTALVALMPAISLADGVKTINGVSAATQFLATSSTMHMTITSSISGATHTFAWDNTPWDVNQGGTGRTSFTNGSILFYFNGFSEDNANFFWNTTTHTLAINGDVDITGCYKVNGTCISSGGGTSQPVLLDGNSAVLGPLVGNTGAIVPVPFNGPASASASYVIYLPDTKLILRYLLSGTNPLVVGFPVATSYPLSDCQGTGYIRGNLGNSSFNQYIQQDGSGAFFVSTGATTTIDELSNMAQGVCSNVASNSRTVTGLTTVSLPDSLVNPVLPLSLSVQ